MENLTFRHKWRDFEGPAAEPYVFPSDPRKYRPLVHGRQPYPGIYRWLITPKTGSPRKHRVLIGQSENLRRRLYEYIKPSTKRDRDCNRLFRKALRDGDRITCHYLEFEAFAINGACLTFDALTSPFIRGLIENLMLMMSPGEGVVVLNMAKQDSWTIRS